MWRGRGREEKGSPKVDRCDCAVCWCCLRVRVRVRGTAVGAPAAGPDSGVLCCALCRVLIHACSGGSKARAPPPLPPGGSDARVTVLPSWETALVLLIASRCAGCRPGERARLRAPPLAQANDFALPQGDRGGVRTNF
jgi:hypothetical protein